MNKLWLFSFYSLLGCLNWKLFFLWKHPSFFNRNYIAHRSSIETKPSAHTPFHSEGQEKKLTYFLDNTAVFRSLFTHYHSTISCLLKSLPSKWFTELHDDVLIFRRLSLELGSILLFTSANIFGNANISLTTYFYYVVSVFLGFLNSRISKWHSIAVTNSHDCVLDFIITWCYSSPKSYYLYFPFWSQSIIPSLLLYSQTALIMFPLHTLTISPEKI